MRQLSNGGRVCESVEDLPNLNGCKYLYLDFETTSGDPTLDSLNTWKNCFIAGICVTADDHKGSWYVPVGHNTGGNLPWGPVYKWLEDIVQSCEWWVNHNVKYDAHVFANNLGVEPNCGLWDTMTIAKLINSDRHSYGLDKLCKDWLGYDINSFEHNLKPYLHKNKDYGWIPVDIMAPYGCQDAITTRHLHKYIMERMPEESAIICDIELKLTKVLFDIERNGMRINPTKVKQKQLIGLRRMTSLNEELESIVGFPFRPHVNEDCFDVLCNMYSLPVLSYNDSGNPSFDSNALKQYLVRPDAPKEVVQKILEYRKLHTLDSLFLNKFLDLNIDGILHPSYNQTVRTGRMSCRTPNMQQNSSESKDLIVPSDGNVIVSSDYSQIEFRTIVHYIQDPDAISAYQRDPDTDFHQWVADLCEIKRKPAKTVNFLMGYGGGRTKLIAALSKDPDLVHDLSEIAGGNVNMFEALARERGELVYNTYHERLPGLRIASKQAEVACRVRGYVKTLYGRRRHIVPDHARKAFNTANQGTAADLMKDRLVALATALPSYVKIIGVVHDEVIMEMPKEAYDENFKKSVADILEHPSVPLRVPVRIGIGASEISWANIKTAPVCQ